MNRVVTLSSTGDLTRTTLAILFLVALLAATFWIMRPFLTPLLWAGMIVIATWPILLWLQRLSGGSRSLAALVMTFVLLMLLIVPLAFAIGTISNSLHTISDWQTSLEKLVVPPPPTWVSSLPLAGGRIAEIWQRFSNSSADIVIEYVTPYIPRLASWFVAQVGSVGLLIFQFILTIAISGVLYLYGETAGSGVCAFARRLAGDKGEMTAILAAKAVRGVALGVVVTALLQAALSGFGLLIAGVPAAGLLTALIFMLCLAQLSPLLILLPAVGWLYWSGQTVTAIGLLIWTVPVGTMDNFVRPVLIKKGVDLPLLLVFAGVIGGLLSLGIAGIFIGPTVLAVSFTLLRSWVSAHNQETLETQSETQDHQKH